MRAGTAVPEDWLGRLLAVARDDPTVATASAACAGADGIPDVAPEEIPGDDAAFRSSSERLRPAICAPRSPLVLARARAIALAGPLDDGFGARATALGF